MYLEYIYDANHSNIRIYLPLQRYIQNIEIAIILCVFCKKQVLVSKSLTIFVAIVEILSRHLDFYSVFAIELDLENCQFSTQQGQ